MTLPIRRKLVFGVITITLLFAALECAARVFTDKPRETKYPLPEFLINNFKYPVPGFADELLLWRMPPGANVPNTQNEVLNNLGFRGPNVQIEKPAGTKRIVCIGGSTTFGSGVAKNVIYTTLLSRWFTAHNETAWEVINLALPGSSSFQALQLYKHIGATLKPDIVILYTGTWYDYTPAVDMDDEAAQAQMLKAKETRRGLSARRLRFYQWMTYWTAPPTRSRRAEFEESWNNFALRANGPRVSASKFKKFLTEFAGVAKKDSPRVMYLIPPIPKATKDRFTDSDAYASIVSSVAANENIEMIDVRSAFQETASEQDPLFLDDIHPSPAGHALITSTIIKKLIDLKIVNVPPFPPESVTQKPILLTSLRKSADYYIGDPPMQVTIDEVLKWDDTQIALPAPGIIHFKKLTIPLGAVMYFDISSFTGRDFKPRPAGAPRNHIRVLYKVEIRAEGKPPKIIFEETIAGDDSVDWIIKDTSHADLSEFGGHTVDIILRTEGTCYSAAWGNPKIFPVD